MARVPTRSGVLRPALGRRTRAAASIMSCFRPRPLIGSRRSGWISMCGVGKSLPITCRSGSISARSALEVAVQNAPGQLVVHTHAQDVVVGIYVLVGLERDRSRIEIRLVLQSDVEVLHLSRPIRGEP